MKMLEVTRIDGNGSQKWLINPTHIMELGAWKTHSSIYFTNGTHTKVLETLDQLHALLRAI